MVKRLDIFAEKRGPTNAEGVVNATTTDIHAFLIASTYSYTVSELGSVNELQVSYCIGQSTNGEKELQHVGRVGRKGFSASREAMQSTANPNRQ